MKEPKPYLLTLVSIFLLISIGLLITTIYLYFNSTSLVVSTDSTRKNNSTEKLTGTRDSLEKIYTAAIKDLDASFAARPDDYSNLPDSEKQVNNSPNKKTIDTTTNNLEKLRKEINSILSDKSPTADLVSAKTKISELQVMVNFLKNRNMQISKENERLYAMLKQVTYNNTKNETSYKKAEQEKGAAIKTSAIFLKAENLQVSATTSTDFIEKETTNADETDKLVGSFSVKNNSGQNVISEVMVVVLKPDGKVLQTSNWENGIFYTSAGKQIYSKKLRFNNNNGESKKLNFSLPAEKYLPGKYIIEVYYDGSVIGKTIKILS